MKYLFFDIECASVSKKAAKICAFGYCLTDTEFRLLKKEDILINPQGGFHLTDRKGEQGLVLPYEYEAFKNYPTFPEVASRIYALLEDKDTLVAGHATMNDVKYLNLEAKRFSLPSFRFDFADTQFVYMNRIGVFNRQFALGTIAEALGVKFTPHRAADDAYATMKIAEAMCREEGVSFENLLEKYSIDKGRIENFEVTQGSSAAQRAYLEEAARIKEEREAARVEFHNFADREKRHRNRNSVSSLKNKTVCFSRKLEENLDLSKPLALKVFALGGFYGFHFDGSHYCVYTDEEAESASFTSLKAVKSTPVKRLSYSEFSGLLDGYLKKEEGQG